MIDYYTDHVKNANFQINMGQGLANFWEMST